MLVFPGLRPEIRRRRSRSAGGSARSTTRRTGTIAVAGIYPITLDKSKNCLGGLSARPPSTGTSTAAPPTDDAFPQMATVLSRRPGRRPRRRNRVRQLAMPPMTRLSDDEKERFARCGSCTRSRRPSAGSPRIRRRRCWRAGGRGRTHEHPLVWTHRSGRRSLVLGASADYVVGMDLDEGRALLGGAARAGHRRRQGVQPRLVRRRHRHLGQPRRPAPGGAVRPGLAARDAAHHGARRRADPVTVPMR